VAPSLHLLLWSVLPAPADRGSVGRVPDVPLRARLDCPPAWLPPVGSALAAAGVTVDPGAAVGVAVAAGRSVSPTVDDWSVASLPHLLVGVRPYAVEVGPWALPGAGPCARCVAADVLDEGGPAGPEVLVRPLAAMAAGWVARDLAAWVRGERPATWLTSWRLDHEPVPESRRWRRHPYCGCGWFDTA
jgi:hypothetical protein